MLEKNPSLQTVNVKEKSEIIVRDRTNNIPLDDKVFEFADTEGKNFKFFDDIEVQQIVKIEKLFENCNGSDAALLSMLANGESYEKTAEKYFMTVSGIKYRLDRLCRICGSENRRELINVIKIKN